MKYHLKVMLITDVSGRGFWILQKFTFESGTEYLHCALSRDPKFYQFMISVLKSKYQLDLDHFEVSDTESTKALSRVRPDTSKFVGQEYPVTGYPV